MTWSSAEAAAEDAQTVRIRDVICTVCEQETYTDASDLSSVTCPFCGADESMELT